MIPKRMKSFFVLFTLVVICLLSVLQFAQFFAQVKPLKAEELLDKVTETTTSVNVVPDETLELNFLLDGSAARASTAGPNSLSRSSSALSTEINLIAEACVYSDTVSASNPIAYWRLGEASGTTAANIGSLGTAVDGTYQSGVTLGATGLVPGDADTAATFDGIAGHVKIPNDDDINAVGPYAAKTFELWFKANALTGKQALYEQGGIHKGFNIYLDDDSLAVGAWNLETGAWVTTTVFTDTTYHVALVYDGSTQMVTGYLNGVSFGSASTGHSAIEFHLGLIAIGSVDDETRWSNSETTLDSESGYYFDGVVDDVALYNTVLSESVIQAHSAGCACFALTLGHTGQGSDPTATPTNSTGCSAGTYFSGESIQLSGAVPAAGWEIDSWSGTDNNSSTAITNTVTMPGSAHSTGVNYGQSCYALTLGHAGNGSDPAASPTNSTGCSSGEYLYGENISLSGASPDTGWAIASWSGTSNNSSTASTNSLTMPAGAHAAGVNYGQSCYALTLGHTGSGSDPAASPTNSTGCSSGEYFYGENISLSGASPDTGWAIASWSGTSNNSSTASTNSLTMPASAHAASVNYVQISHDLTIVVNPTGSGTTDPSAGVHTYVYGSVVEISATPAAGFKFDHWSGDCTGSGTCQVNMDADKTVTAHFVENIPPDTEITDNPPNPSTSTNASFSFTSTEIGSTFECQLDGGGFSACTSPHVYTDLDPGEHTFEVRAIDGAGNIDPTPASYSWTINWAIYLPIITN